jgi:hypothetical protein
MDPKVTAEPFTNASVKMCEDIYNVDRLTRFYCRDSTPRNTDAIFYGNTLAKSAGSPGVICAGRRSSITGCRRLGAGSTSCRRGIRRRALSPS